MADPTKSILSFSPDDYQSIVESAKKPLTPGSAAAESILALLPMAIGAMVAGRRGAGAGAQGAALGLGNLINTQKEDEKERVQAALLGAQHQQSLNRSILSDALATERAKQLEDYRQANRVEIQNMKGSTAAKGLDQPTSEGILQEIADMTGQDVEAVKEQFPTNRSATLFTGLKQAQSRMKSINAQMADTARRALEATNRVEEAQTNGLDYVSKPDQKRTALTTELYQAYASLQGIQQRLLESYQRNRGKQWVGTEAFNQKIDEALAIIDFKNLQKMGANFTMMEKGLTEGALASVGDFKNWLATTMRGKDIAQATERSMEVNKDVLKRRLGAAGAYIVGEEYSPEIRKLFPNIPVDQAGVAQPTGLIAQKAGEFRQLSTYLLSSLDKKGAGAPAAPAPAPAPTPAGLPQINTGKYTINIVGGQ